MIFAHSSATSRNPIFAFVLAGGLLLLQPPAVADVFKWVNENNEVQYTQMQPPPGIKYIRIQTNEHPNTLKTDADEAAAAEEQPAEEESPAEGDADAMSKYEAEVARISKQNCTIAHNNLTQLNMGGHLRYKNEKGEYVNMTEEERQQRIKEANEQIKQFCKNQAE